MNISLNFDDVHLVPRIRSSILSRDGGDLDISTKFNESIILGIPIIASPMRDVCDGYLASKLSALGGMGIIHRFWTIENHVEEYKKSPTSACAIGVNGDSTERFDALFEAGCRIFCIDVANGASLNVQKMIESLDSFPVDLIVGNVASKECYHWLEQFDKVKAIRVGIAGGNACTTKNATGIYHGMISCIAECQSVKKRTLLIADGGIKEPQDMCKAIAFGADLVMMGSRIAATCESPAELINRDGKIFKVFHGSASFEIQKAYKEKPKYVEGKTKLIDFDNESLASLISRYCEGLISSMSYFDARTICEYKKNMDFVVNK